VPTVERVARAVHSMGDRLGTHMVIHPMSTGAVGARRLVPNSAEEPPPPPSSGDSPPHPFSCSIGPPPSPSLHPHAAELTGSTVDCRTTLTVECRTTLTAGERRHISPSPPPRHRAATSGVLIIPSLLNATPDIPSCLNR
jgi:hypothetical protein